MVLLSCLRLSRAPRVNPDPDNLTQYNFDRRPEGVLDMRGIESSGRRRTDFFWTLSTQAVYIIPLGKRQREMRV
jgi:hypothetical protein